MNWQTALILFAMVSVAVMPVMIAKEVTSLWSREMWWIVLAIVIAIVGFVIWFGLEANP